MKNINRDNIEEIVKSNCYIYHKILLYSNKNEGHIKLKINGKLKLWKTRPKEFKLPIKYGTYTYGYLTEKNCYNFYVE